MLHTRSLKKNRAFRLVYGQGQSTANRLLVLYVLKNGTLENRLGITVGKKVGKAVTRNRVKRLVRESYRLSEPWVSPGYDLVFVARVSAGALNRREAFAQVSRSVRHLLRKHRLMAADTGGGEVS